jgi:hypothetical protein
MRRSYSVSARLRDIRRDPQSALNHSLTIRLNSSASSAPHLPTTRRAAMDGGLEHKIRVRAYEIWQMSGCLEGRADEHWAMAERELIAQPPAQKVRRAAAARTDARISAPKARAKKAAH